MHLNFNIFGALQIRHVEGNQIKTLGENKDGKWNGLGNSKNIAYLYANSNNLGVDKIYELGIDGNGKNENKDALACLKDKNQLYYLRLSSNTDLKWIEYLENLSSLRYLYLDKCLELVNVAKLR